MHQPLPKCCLGSSWYVNLFTKLVTGSNVPLGSTCSNLETFISNEQVENAEKYGTVSMYAVTNFKHLCNWQIGLLSMGTFFTVAIVGGVAAVLGTGAMSGGVGGGAVADYVAL